MSNVYGLNDKESDYVKSHPVNTYYIWRSRESAVKETEKRFGMNGHNDKSDAFRHCFWSALLARDISYTEALKFTTLHEMRPGNDLVEKRMDLHNNKVGANIGRSGGADAELSRRCFDALSAGKLTHF